jgi:hypothetical protein
MKKFFIFLIGIFLSLQAFSQLEVKDNSFREVPGFTNTNPDPDYQTDDNYFPFAIIKIKTENINDKQRRELLFQGNAATYFMLEYKTDAIWLYLTAQYADYIKVSHPDLSTCEFKIPMKLKPNQGYELTLTNSSAAASYGSLTITTKPEKGAFVTLDSIELGWQNRTPYTNEMILAGKHEIKVSKMPYETVTRIIEIKKGEHLDLEIEMQFSYGTLNIETTPPGATVIVDKTEYGTTPITLDSIIVGKHLVLLKKDGLKLMSQNIELEHDKPININKTFETCPVGAINGVFSVSDTSQVYFSKGNLQYLPSVKTWRFAENQYDFIGKDNKKAERVDLFGWNTAKNPMNRSKNSEDYPKKFVDWGHNPIANGGKEPDIWRTLNYKEWEYLFEKRKTESGMRFVIAKVNATPGVIIFPDNWKKDLYDLKDVNNPESNSHTYQPSGDKIKVSNYYMSSNNISLSEWKRVFEANGAVFLPAAGYDGINVKVSAAEVGMYWTSPDSDFYEYVDKPDRFTAANKYRVDALLLFINSCYGIYPENRLSVRLVH